MDHQTHDPLALLLHVGDAFTAMFRHGPSFQARLTAESWFASAGAAHCIWNWVGLTSASPVCVATLREAVATLRERRVEGLVCYPPDAAAGLAETFTELGLDVPDVVPLMVCDPADLPPAAPTDVVVERLTAFDTERLAAAVAIIAVSFDIPADQTALAFTAPLLAEPAVIAYTAMRGGAVVGLLAGTRFGQTVSIDIMSVDPARQRQGIGRALMLHTMHDQIAAGATSFHLLSSLEGRGLYQQVGFTTLLPALTRLIPLDPIPSDQVVP